MNLLRQELAGTSIYLEILLKTAAAAVDNNEAVKEEKLKNDEAVQEEKLQVENDEAVEEEKLQVENDEAVKEEKLEGIAVVKLVSFCEQVLREASEFQSNMEETTNMEIHRVLELRSPIIVKVPSII